MARRVLLHHHLDDSKELKNLLRMICHLYRLRYDHDLRFLESDSLSDLEGVMTNLALQETLFGSKGLQALISSRDTLRELIAFTIEVSLQGPTCDLHKQLVSLIKPEDVIVSTNYDLILDDALRTKKRLDDSSYALPFSRVHDGNDWKKPEESSGSFEFLKLHGSTNWARCIECSTILRTTKYNTFRPLASLECPRCQRTSGLVRLIIPPIQSKEYNDEPYRFLWLQAARKIEDVERVVVLGYRFSPNDMAVEALLHRISARSPAFEIMNNTKDREAITGRIRRIFPGANPRWTGTLPEFFKAYQP